MKTLLVRSLTGIVYVLSVILSIFFSPYLTQTYFFIIALLGLWEFYHNSTLKNIRPNVILGFLLAIFTYLIIAKPYYYAETCTDCLTIVDVTITSLVIVSSLSIFIVELYRKEESPFTNIAYTFLGVAYVVVPMALTNRIVTFNGIHLPWLMMIVFIFAWCNDTFAYLTGMAIGKHKLFERISPKKTWEGSIGGFVSVIIAAIIIHKCLQNNENYEFLKVYDYAIIALITSIVGTWGDLVESLFKRQLSIKDSGKILPGHGGILDRFDILFMVIPAVYVYLIVRNLFDSFIIL